MFTISTRFEGTQGTRTSWGRANVALVIMVKLRERVGPCTSQSTSLGQTSMLLGHSVPVTLWQILSAVSHPMDALTLWICLGKWARGTGWRWMKYTNAGGKWVAAAAFIDSDYRAKATSTANYISWREQTPNLKWPGLVPTLCPVRPSHEGLVRPVCGDEELGSTLGRTWGMWGRGTVKGLKLEQVPGEAQHQRWANLL